VADLLAKPLKECHYANRYSYKEFYFISVCDEREVETKVIIGGLWKEKEYTEEKKLRERSSLVGVEVVEQ